MRVVLVGGPRMGKSSYARKLRHVDGVPTFCTDARSQCKEPEDGVVYLPEMFAAQGMWSAASQFVADVWLSMPGPWCIEGVAAVRALRKWSQAHSADELPCDKIIKLGKALVETSPGQDAMGKGVESIWNEISERFAPITQVFS